MKKLFLTFIVVLSVFGNVKAQNCSENIIYVKKRLVGNQSVWEETNRNYICENQPEDFTVDLNKMEKLEIPNWLKANSFCINFDKSFELIHNTHQLDINNDVHKRYIIAADYEIIVKKNFYGIVFQDLKIGLNDVDITRIDQSKYYSNYKRAIDKNIFHGVKLKSTDGFILGSHNFSAPLLLSIIEKIEKQTNEEALDEKICFFQFTFIEEDTKAVMKVTYKNQTLYYDFSDEPGRKSLKTIKNVSKNEIIKNSL
ncbi:hypothetical protein [Flavobacterium sp.]|uniref:hypothetical protein n=1 Tax=Flavobacterium sp. TaxID=239 RepID=UPI00261FF424|nr:hypothetical protein [Flavobacterium sp.]